MQLVKLWCNSKQKSLRKLKKGEMFSIQFFIGNMALRKKETGLTIVKNEKSCFV